MQETWRCDMYCTELRVDAVVERMKAAGGITLKIIVQLQSRTPAELPQTPQAAPCRVICHADESPAGSQAKQPS